MELAILRLEGSCIPIGRAGDAEIAEVGDVLACPRPELFWKTSRDKSGAYTCCGYTVYALGSAVARRVV